MGNWLHKAFTAEQDEVQSEFDAELSHLSPSGTETTATRGYKEGQESQGNEAGGREEEEEEERNTAGRPSADHAASESQEEAQTDQDVTNESSQMSSLEEDEEEADGVILVESILKYARFHGLTSDYSREQTTISLPDPPADLSSDLEDPPQTAPFEVPRLFTTREVWAVDQDAALLLKSVIALAGDFDAENVQQPDVHRMRDLKLEIPILRSDCELDMMEFRRKADRDTPTVPLRLEPADEEDDEGFDWPTGYKTLPAQFEARARFEKLEMTKEHLRYLQNMLMDTFTAEDQEAMTNAELVYLKNSYLEPVTPPLLPLSPPVKPVQLSPIGHLEPESEGTSPTREEARLLDEQLMKEDAIVPLRKRKAPDHDPMLFDENDVEYYYSPLASIGKSPSLSPLKRVKIAELKVEGPLTPPTSVQIPGKNKNVIFAEDLEEVIPNWPPMWGTPDDAPNSEDYVDGFFNETVAPIARQAESDVQHEQLQEADSTMRVDVPIMDFSVPEPPWKKAARRQTATTSGGHRFLSYLDASQENLKRTVWSGISKINLLLPWRPFPLELDRAAIDEHIVDDGALTQLLQVSKVDDVVHSESLTWKPEGLRVLDMSDEDEDELEPATFEEKTDLLALLRKRKLQLDQEQEAALPSAVGGPNVLPGRQSERFRNQQSTGARHLCLAPSDRPKTETHKGLMFGGLFSASEALTEFMDTQGRVTKKRKENEGFHLPVAAAKQSAGPINPPPPPNVMTRTEVQDHGTSNPQPTPPLVTPTLPENLPPRTFILSSSLFAHRRLMRHISLLYPAASIIERDFTSRAGFLTSPSHLKIKGTSSGPMEAEEADILLSPSTSLILTSLQKINQRSLPGQAMRNPVKERIQRVALRCERLLVFVSEGRPPPAPPTTILDHFSHTRQSSVPPPVHTFQDRDCDAITQLTSFSATLDTDITISYIPGGEEDLAKWIVAAMHRYGVDSAKANLLQDETLWEIWLRAAGMNAFAAQVVLSELKGPEGQSAGAEREMGGEGSQLEFGSLQSEAASKPLEYGLPAFVLMGGEERMRRFEAFLGGRRVLRRVSQILDRPWEGLLTGFASCGIHR